MQCHVNIQNTEISLLHIHSCDKIKLVLLVSMALVCLASLILSDYACKCSWKFSNTIVFTLDENWQVWEPKRHKIQSCNLLPRSPLMPHPVHTRGFKIFHQYPKSSNWAPWAYKNKKIKEICIICYRLFKEPNRVMISGQHFIWSSLSF